MFKKITKNLGLHLNLKTADLQHLIYTTIVVEIKISPNILYRYIPTFITDSETQRTFNESIKNNFAPTFDAWTGDRETINTGLDYQLDTALPTTIVSR